MDVTARYHQGDLFSREAHASINNNKQVLQNKIVAYVKEQGFRGATCDEIEQALDLSHQTASARATECKALGKLFVNGKRKTRSGRNAAVLIAKDYVL